MKRTLFSAALFGGLAVILGAFGAHALKEKLEPSSLAVFDTAVKYQFYHALALIAVFLLNERSAHRYYRYAATCFTIGICLFSGSLYLLSTASLTGLSLKALGPITPLGGLFFIAGWVLLLLSTLKKES